MNINLIKNSQDLSGKASEVLKKTNAIEVFSKLGKVEIIGSLRLNLLYRFDIDLLVISENIDKEKAQTVTKQFLDSNIFQTVALADYQSFPAFDMPLGFYWELVVLHEGKNWKFDVWYLKREERYTNLVLSSIKKFKKALSRNPEKAEIILKIKADYFNGVKYKDQVKSFDIYTAVLEKGVNNVDEFSKYLRKE
jgi:sRNA-binding regulator protein Hfq